MYDYELMSYTVHHSTCYSDGNCDDQTFTNSSSAIGICADCEQPFWKQDAHSDDDPYDTRFDELEKAKDIFDLESMMLENFRLDVINYYQKLIDDGFPNTFERKIYLRIRLWWAINDLRRNEMTAWQLIKTGKIKLSDLRYFYRINKKGRADFRSFEIRFIQNLEKLVPLLEKEEMPDLLTLAEIYREMGKFKLALSTIKKMEEKMGNSYKQIKRASIFRRKKVFKLS